MSDDPPRELQHILHSLPEWNDWVENNPGYYTAAFREGLVAHVLKFGLREPISDVWVSPKDVVRGADLREGLIARGLVSRQRAVLRIIEETIFMDSWASLRIYAPEAITEMALRLRSRFPKFLGSEFTLDPARRSEMYPIPFEDLTQLTLPSNTFDLVTTNEVLEHVPDIDAALSEMARILKPGAWHVGTCPLLNQYGSVVRSKLEFGRIKYLAEPEYHGDPFGHDGSLVFELPGWDILDRARACGFSAAHFRLLISEFHGCIGSRDPGILVLCLQK